VSFAALQKIFELSQEKVGQLVGVLLKNWLRHLRF
jgi:hypothetical protein